MRFRLSHRLMMIPAVVVFKWSTAALIIITTFIYKALFWRPFWSNPRTPLAPNICLRESHLGSFPADFVASHGEVGPSPSMIVLNQHRYSREEPRCRPNPSSTKLTRKVKLHREEAFSLNSSVEFKVTKLSQNHVLVVIFPLFVEHNESPHLQHE